MTPDSPSELHKATDRYLAFLQSEENRSHLTIDRYRQSLHLTADLLNVTDPSEIDDFEIDEEWRQDKMEIAMFVGLLTGATGWDMIEGLPPALETSLEEAKTALSIANYRSCVVMCRRSLEALLKYAFPRLLNRPAEDSRGRGLMLSAMIEQFRRENPLPIPVHLLHIADSVRVVGNVPGAHATEIPNYTFTRYDAEFALASVHHFLNQYFGKIDTDVNEYYTLTIDISSGENGSDSSGDT